MRKVVILVVAAAALMTSACNTISGVGRDVQAAGKAVAGAADDAKH
ncbi:MAG TPA: entericidin A/B family lipoprotein [Phenylobacterium sp.]|nr:entericidin A/B family lipoprotein [Phenylobacterium sp.]